MTCTEPNWGPGVRLKPEPRCTSFPKHIYRAMQAKLECAVDFVQLLGGLKTVLRQGWVDRRVPARIESVADHSWRMAAILAFIAPQLDPTVHVERCVKMALVHDIAEAICGDITPSDNIKGSDKHQIELNAVERIAKSVKGASGSDFATELI